MSGSAPSAQAARKFCETMLPKVSRSFALSIAALPELLQAPVRNSYLLCRIVDTVEDDRALAREPREALFDAFDEMMQNPSLQNAQAFEGLTGPLQGDDAALTLCRGATLVVAEFLSLSPEARLAITEPVLEMSKGMRDYCRRAHNDGGISVRDMDDLERYCYYVAGTVGNLLTRLFQLALPDLEKKTLEQLEQRAVPFGWGLQMVNIVKDVLDDADRGDHFLPMDLLRAQGVDVQDISSPHARPALKRVVNEVCERAREHLKKAIEYTLLWPAPAGVPLRQFCAVPLGLAFATLNEVQAAANSMLPGQKKPKVGRGFTMSLFQKIHAKAGQDVELRNLLNELASAPIAQAG